jgi:polysaccharide biosynthesis transport protein
MDNTLKTPEEVARCLRLPNLATVPDFININKRISAGGGPAYISLDLPEGDEAAQELVPIHYPLSGVTEAYRKLRTAILLSRAAEPPRTVLFTSATAGEGKTITTLNTALVFAQMGARVLVIDADLRCSGCHRILGTGNWLGLTEVLTGQRDANEVIQPIAQNRVFLLSSGSLPPNPAELLGSQTMRDLLTGLRKEYDYILIDSTPLSLVTDSVLLSTLVDGVVLVVNGQKTHSQAVKSAYADLSYARAKVLGVVLNRVSQQSRDYGA